MGHSKVGGGATFDPKDRAKIAEIQKRGEWYTVRGHVKGQPVSVDIHAKDIESRDRQSAEALMRRGLLGVAGQRRST